MSDAHLKATDDGAITTQRIDGAGIVTLERPHKRNALTYTMWSALPAAVSALSQDPNVRYLVLRGAGAHFSVGADLREVHAHSASIALARRFCVAITQALRAIATCPLPTVAAVRGQAIGGALELALAADFRIAADNAQMQFPFVNLGMVPDPSTLRRLAALVGDARARHLLFAADMLPSGACLAQGLVEALVPEPELDAAITTRMAAYAQPSAYVLGRVKDLLSGMAPDDWQAAAELRAHSFVHGGVREAAARFLARRG